MPSAIKVSYQKHTLKFKSPILTSRGGMSYKDTWLLIIEDNHRCSIGECNYLVGMSMDPYDRYVNQLDWLVENLENTINAFLAAPKFNLNDFETLIKELESSLSQSLTDFPSIVFGLETLLSTYLFKIKSPSHLPGELANQTPVIFPSDFTRGLASIPINGLIWMGDVLFMEKQIKDIQRKKFKVIKVKIGALDLEKEIQILKKIREQNHQVEIRLDANGGFENDSINDINDKLNLLSEFKIHSLEQPVMSRDKLKQVIKLSPIPIALDESLIGLKDFSTLLDLNPAYLVIKPSLIGGWKKCLQLIERSSQNDIKWWITSALESNIGLNALAQWTFLLNGFPGNAGTQGLGTGQIYQNNFPSSLYIDQGALHYR